MLKTFSANQAGFGLKDKKLEPEPFIYPRVRRQVERARGKVCCQWGDTGPHLNIAKQTKRLHSGALPGKKRVGKPTLLPFLGDRPTAGLRTLAPPMEVRILLPQPTWYLWLRYLKAIKLRIISEACAYKEQIVKLFAEDCGLGWMVFASFPSTFRTLPKRLFHN